MQMVTGRCNHILALSPISSSNVPGQPKLVFDNTEMRTPWSLRERHSGLSAVTGELLDELFTFLHRIYLGGKAENAAVQDTRVVLQVVAAPKRKRTSQGAVSDSVAWRVERELRATVELLAIRDDVELTSKHLMVKLERFASIAGERYVKRSLHECQCGETSIRREVPEPLAVPVGLCL